MRILFAAVAALLVVGCTAAPEPSTPATASATSSSASSTAGSAAGSASATASTTHPKLPAPVSSQPATTAKKPSPSTPPTTNKTLAGTTIVLNPGHNGGNASNTAAINRQVPAGFGEYKACDTTGTETNAGYPEHAFNWDVSLRVRTLLRARGVQVILTRNSDTGVGPCVDERARIGNQASVAAVVSIHADGAPTSGHGFHVCEDSRQPGGAAVAANSHSLTVAVHDALLRGSGMTVSSYLGSNGYFPRDDLAGLNLATVPSTFLEIGNMRNSADASIQSSAIGRQHIAVAVADGILAWLGR